MIVLRFTVILSLIDCSKLSVHCVSNTIESKFNLYLNYHILHLKLKELVFDMRFNYLIQTNN
jgi:hypothetical protein